MHRNVRRWAGVGGFLSTAAALALFLPATGEAGPSTIQLFNGRDMSRFYTWLVNHKYEDPDKVFSVATIDGAPAIRVTGKHFGGFATKEEFDNYHLVVEYSWGKATYAPRAKGAKDSGILLHCVGRDGNTGKDFNGPWMRSQECQIIQGGTGDFIMVGGYDESGNMITPKLTATVRKEGNETIYDPKGETREFQGGRINWFGRDPQWKDLIDFRGKQDVETPGNGWTRVEAICDGDSITNIVNGTVVNKGTKSSLTRGKIMLQSEGAEVYFRKIELTPLAKKKK